METTTTKPLEAMWEVFVRDCIDPRTNPEQLSYIRMIWFAGATSGAQSIIAETVDDDEVMAELQAFADMGAANDLLTGPVAGRA